MSQQFCIKVYGESCNYYISSHSFGGSSSGDISKSKAKKYSSYEAARAVAVDLYIWGIISQHWEIVRA